MGNEPSKTGDQADLKSSKSKGFQSPAAMLQWQWRSMLEELTELQRHLSDPSCPCILADSGEYCGPKHALGLHTLAKETVAMAPAYKEMLEDLAEEALVQHNALKERIVCGQPHKDEKETVEWSRQWRKRIEPIYYHATCKIKSPAKMRQDYPEYKPTSLILDQGGVIPEEFAKFKVDIELSRSPEWDISTSPVITSPEKAQIFFRKMRRADREYFLVICLDTRNRLVGLFEQAIGGHDQAIVDPLVLTRIITLTNASQLILAHNHPSGEPEPSGADKALMGRLQEALKILGVEMLDFLVVGHKQDYSVMHDKTLPATLLMQNVSCTLQNTADLETHPVPKEQLPFDFDRPQEVVPVAAPQPTTASVVEWHKDNSPTLFQALDKEGKSLGMFTTLEQAAEKVQISGKCASKDPGSCHFTIRRHGKSRTVKRAVKITKTVSCHVTGVNELVKNARQLVTAGTCVLKKKAKLRQEPTAKITGSCSTKGCNLTVKGIVETATTSTPAGLPKAIETVIDKLGKRGRPGEVITDKTFAPGISTSNRYDMQFKVIDATDLIVSHDPFTFVLNKKYTAKLQPRLRERLANQSQVRKIAAGLDPEKLLIDTKAIDTGSPIINAQNYVLCGNGRVMALILAATEHPANIAKYKLALRDIVPKYNLPVEPIAKMKLPVLVRLLLTKTNEQAFAEECNARPTIEASAIEKARTDAEKITSAMLNGLDVLEGEPIEEALRSGRNKPFVTAFLSKLPENEQALLVDARGQLNSDGVRRMGMAIFVATFKGDVGLRLAAQFFEALDTNVKNAFNGILRALGGLAQAENLIANKQRDTGYTIGADLARAITIFSNLRSSDMSVSNYINQQQMISRELTPFQERVLQVLDEHSRSAKRIGAILSNYAQAVIDSPPPGQVSMIKLEPITKEQMFENAVRKVVAEAVAVMNCGSVCLLQPAIDYEWLVKKLKCPLSKSDLVLALSWRPLREFVTWALGLEKEVELCSIGTEKGIYQIVIYDTDSIIQTQATKRANLVPGMMRVYTPYKELVYTVKTPDAKAQELTWSPQEINRTPARRDPAEQVAMFSPGGCSMKQEANLQTDALLTAIGCQIGVGCLASSSKPKGKAKPVCTSEQKTKRESCIIQVKAKLPVGCNRKEWSKPQDQRMEGCYNPFSVCTATIGCRIQPAASH